MTQVKAMKIHIENDCQNIVALKIDETPANLLPVDLVVGTQTKTGGKTAKNRRRALRSTKCYVRRRSVRNRPFIIGDFPTSATLKAGRTFRGSNLAVAVKKPKRKLQKRKISVYNARARAHHTCQVAGYTGKRAGGRARAPRSADREKPNAFLFGHRRPGQRQQCRNRTVKISCTKSRPGADNNVNARPMNARRLPPADACNIIIK